MRKERYLYLIQHPQAVTEDDLHLLKVIYTQFPYFQVASILYSIAAKKFNITWFQESIPATSARLSNRVHWYNLLEYKASNENVLPPEDAVPTTTVLQQENTSAEVETPAEVETSAEVEQEMGATLFKNLVNQELQSHEASELFLDDVKWKQPQSFSDWLNCYTSENKSEHHAPVVSQNESPQKKQNKNIIDNIIKQNPGPIRVKKERFYNAETSAKASLLEHEDLVSETLARIYESQGNLQKALRAYEILILKYPEKNLYFSEQINRLKQL